MSDIWPTANSKEPCPVCGKKDWCAFGQYSIKCMREPSDHPSRDGGWYHPYGGNKPKPFLPPKRDVAEPLKDAFEMAAKFFDDSCAADYERLAHKLNVGTPSLQWLFAGWSQQYQAWSFPMSDGNSKIIGIRLRNEAGDKWAVKGSRQGLFIPNYFDGDEDGTCFIAEGPTDTAALLTLGLYSIGRPSCNSNPDQLRIALRLANIRRVVIVADNDNKRRASGQQWSPGIDGAKALGTALKLPHVIWLPPSKDVREFVRLGGTKQIILSAIKQMVWHRK